jgi:hypothetical protein
MWGMNSQRTGLRIAAVLFAIFAIAHAVRLFKHAKVMVATHQIPLEVSWIALIIAAVLSIWMWRLSAATR